MKIIRALLFASKPIYVRWARGLEGELLFVQTLKVTLFEHKSNAFLTVFDQKVTCFEHKSNTPKPRKHRCDGVSGAGGEKQNNNMNESHPLPILPPFKGEVREEVT